MAVAAAERRPRVFRERRDILNDFSGAELIKRYRLDREGIMFVTDLVRDAIWSPTARNKAISPELKVIATLRYLATGKMQQCNSDDLGPSQQTICAIVKETVYALTNLDVLRKFIVFPTSEAVTTTKQREFLAHYGMHSIIGVIDGTRAAASP